MLVSGNRIGVVLVYYVDEEFLVEVCLLHVSILTNVGLELGHFDLQVGWSQLVCLTIYVHSAL